MVEVKTVQDITQTFEKNELFWSGEIEDNKWTKNNLETANAELLVSRKVF